MKLFFFQHQSQVNNENSSQQSSEQSSQQNTEYKF